MFFFAQNDSRPLDESLVDVLSPFRTSRTRTVFGNLLNVTRQRKLPMRINEINMCAKGGVVNVSDRFIAALFATDLLYEIAVAVRPDFNGKTILSILGRG